MSRTKLFDRLIFEIQKEGQSVASISIGYNDLAMITEKHDIKRADVLEDMISTLISEAEKKASSDISEG